MITYQGSRYEFSHPIIAGYLASKAMVSSGPSSQISDLPSCIQKTLAMYYLAYFGDVTAYINRMIQDDDILHTNHLIVARWLQAAPKNKPWRSSILRTLTAILQKEKDTLSLAAKIISALAFSGDNGVSYYFRQLLKSDHPNLKQLAALGCGILRDKKTLVDLNEMLQEQSPTSIRSASLAMAAIGEKQALEVLASNLLNGNELVRRCAAEALANETAEGHPALKEGSTMEDLMVRRAVTYGLIRVNLPWAIKIVENMQLEDSEWVVRNAAIEAFDELKKMRSFAPKAIPDLTDAQWLIKYATRIGTSVAPGNPAESLVLKALANGTQEEMLYALDYLRATCNPQAVEQIYAAFSSNSGEVRDMAYYVLWLMMIAGIRLPVSIKYNVK
jgi:HEAT repeat protein